jgi:26S proteasome regulatory subunit N9
MENLATSIPEEKELVDRIADYRKKKLWHQFGVEILTLVNKPNVSGQLIDFYTNIVAKVSKNLDKQQYARFCLVVARQHQDSAGVLQFLEKIETEVTEDVQAMLICHMERVRVKVAQGDLKAAKTLLEDGKKHAKAYVGIIDASVQSNVYLAASEYYKMAGPAADFLKNSLLYLTYTPLASIPIEEQQRLAAAVSLAAVRGEGIYNFGELLQHPVLIKLHNTPDQYLSDLLRAFNDGNLKAYRAICATHPEELKKSEAFLNQKIQIMALIEMIFKKQSHSRPVSFEEIAQTCEMDILQVEHLVMKSFSLGVLKGDIDEVAQTVRVKWVQPRVLDVKQLTSVNARLSAWSKQVESGAIYLQSNAPELLSMHV